MKFTNHIQETRRRVTIDCSEPQVTDQSFKKAVDINNIMKQYEKTGVLPSGNNRQPQFIDTTLIPSLEESFNIVNQAYDLFYQLPATIRKLMDNDASKLEAFLSDPQNHELCLQYGLITKPQETTPTEGVKSTPGIIPSENTQQN
ncbi:internal scaffolding protein [Apis mellifera associated microvirus 29]|nr:internal scaffolding protein [Apis mellifera associated microvirus 29]